LKNRVPMKSKRKKDQALRKFKEAAYVLAKNGIGVTERHNMFVDCVNTAKQEIAESKFISEDKQKAIYHLNAHVIFVEKALENYPEFFKGVKL